MIRALLAAIITIGCASPLPADDRLDAGTEYLRLLRPRTGATVYSRHPWLAWFSSDTTVSYRVEICRDRGCARPLTSIDIAGRELEVVDTLPPGRVFWRVRPRRDGRVAGWASPTGWFIVGCGDNGDPRARRLGWRGRAQRDVDGDGLADLVLPDGSIYRSEGSRFGSRPYGSLLRNEEWFTGPAGDLNGDGYLDLAAADASALAVWTYHGPLPPGLASPARPVPIPEGAGWSFPATGFWHDPFVGDIDGDGYDDLLAASRRASTTGAGVGAAYVFRGGARGVSQSPSQRYAVALGTQSASSPMATADLDGDGFDDTLFLNAVQQGVPLLDATNAFVLRGSPSGWLVPPSFTRTGRINLGFNRGAALGDLEGFGVGGAVVASAESGGTCVRGFLDVLGDASGELSPTLCGSDDGYAREVEAGDVDGDGRADLLVALAAPGRPSALSATSGVALHRAATGYAFETLVRPAGIAAGPAHAGLADVNGDGMMDAIVYATTTEGRVVALVYRGTESGLGSPERVP